MLDSSVAARDPLAQNANNCLRKSAVRGSTHDDDAAAIRK